MTAIAVIYRNDFIVAAAESAIVDSQGNCAATECKIVAVGKFFMCGPDLGRVLIIL